MKQKNTTTEAVHSWAESKMLNIIQKVRHKQISVSRHYNIHQEDNSHMTLTYSAATRLVESSARLKGNDFLSNEYSSV